MDYRNGSTGNFRTGYGVDVHYTSEVQNNAEVSGCLELSIQRDSYGTFRNPRFWKKKRKKSGLMKQTGILPEHSYLPTVS